MPFDDHNVPGWDPQIANDGFRITMDEQASFVIQALTLARLAGYERVFFHSLQDDRYPALGGGPFDELWGLVRFHDDPSNVAAAAGVRCLPDGRPLLGERHATRLEGAGAGRRSGSAVVAVHAALHLARSRRHLRAGDCRWHPTLNRALERRRHSDHGATTQGWVYMAGSSARKARRRSSGRSRLAIKSSGPSSWKRLRVTSTCSAAIRPATTTSAARPSSWWKRACQPVRH